MNEKPQPLLAMGTNGALMPKNFEGLWRLSEIMAASGMMPKNIERPETVFVAVQMGLEVGLSPMQAVQNIAVVNGRPVIWGDAMLALVRGSGILDSISETMTGTGDETAAVCTVTRKGEGGETVGRFSVADAKRANLWGKAGPWTQYPKRMLQMRARAFALRDKFPDVLKGLHAREEIESEQYMGQVEVLSSAATLREIQSKAPSEPQEHYDSRGVPWDAAIHSAGKTRNADGTWRRRKGAPIEDVARAEDVALREESGGPDQTGEPQYSDVMEWVKTSQTQDELETAMDAARLVQMDKDQRDDLDAAYTTQLDLIERMVQS